MIDNMMKHGQDTAILHQFSKDCKDGLYGRIALSKSNFLKLGGYDENFEPTGWQAE